MLEKQKQYLESQIAEVKKRLGELPTQEKKE